MCPVLGRKQSRLVSHIHFLLGDYQRRLLSDRHDPEMAT